MTPAEQKRAAKEFVAKWQAADGNEKGEANSFWIELCQQVLGMPNPVGELEFERPVKGRFLDIFYEDMGILIENKSRGLSLDAPEQRGNHRDGSPRMVTPYEQAKWYADNMQASIRPRWILTCNFDEIRIYDLEDEYPEKSYETLLLAELPEQYHRLSFFTRKEGSRLEREKELSVQAGAYVGRLYNALASRYHDIANDKEEQRSLNVLIVRLVFLLYAEDADLLQKRNAFYSYLEDRPAAGIRGALLELFDVLNTPDGERGRLYANDDALAFPYVNGGLFDGEILVPAFNDEAKAELLASSTEFNWSGISPTIFGAVFESTLNPETRRAGGMHYTSIENIHKVTGPLFYDALLDELREIEGMKTLRSMKQRLRAFQFKLSHLKFLDPACGSGNFLTETYLSLRKLELRVIEDIIAAEGGSEGQTSMGMTVENPIMVNIGQFYGIEINDFAVSVAKTALWIAEEQMLDRTQELLPLQTFDFLPLKSNSNIVEANALRMDWNDVLSASECDYLMGNPPFLGARTMSSEQKEDLEAVASDVRNRHDLDYVTGWYIKGAQMMQENHGIRCALVSTNSICQGAQPGNIWGYLIDEMDVRIRFAWRTFVWDSEATDKAHVHVVIVGFSNETDDWGEKKLFTADKATIASNINGYLIDAPDIYVKDRKEPICAAPKMANGNQPRDGGNFVLKPGERSEILQQEPALKRFIRPYIGSEEFLKRKERWCIWLESATEEEIDASQILRNRVEAVREFRASSKAKTTQGYAKTPALFAQRPQKQGVDFLLVPMTSSERRKYLPIGYMDKSVVASNAVFVIPDATLYQFGVLSSQVHNAWMRTVAGRLKSDYRYSKEIVYNCFVWPGADGANGLASPIENLVTADQRTAIVRTAQGILDARAAHPDSTLANLYDPDKMPADLRSAHEANDAAVEAAYGVDFGGDEEKIVAHLFGLYANATKEE